MCLSDQLQLVSACLILLAALRAVKLAGFRSPAPLPALDLALVLAFAYATGAATSAGPWPALALAVPAFLLVLVFALDAALFSVFTIELGPSDLVGVVLSLFYPETAGTERARGFLRAHKSLALVPLLALLVFAAPVLAACGLERDTALADGAGSPLEAARRAALLLGFALLLFDLAPLLHWSTWLHGVSLAAVTLLPPDLTGRAPPFAFGLLAAFGVGLGIDGKVGQSLIIDLFRARLRPPPRGFEPCPEDVAALALEALEPARTRLFGALRGAPVVLVTLESVGRTQLALEPEDQEGARVPFLSSLAARAVKTTFHFAPSPTTNNAHLALYAGDYLEDAPERGAFGAPELLAAAGYETIYMTAATTAHYGLRRLVERAGFGAVVDGPSFDAEPGHGRWPFDQVLLSQGLERLEALMSTARGPVFLHVHLTNTHVPYRILDPRFSRRTGDLGRFLDAIEETDALLAALFEGLVVRGIVTDPLIVVSSDHGQSFGGFGYHCHGSAVVADQIRVPLLMVHPALEPTVLPWSSHFDVLPTILDLVGVESPMARFGGSIFRASRPSGLLVWAGHPSRLTTSSMGWLRGDRKVMVDLVVERAMEMGWDDSAPKVLDEDQRQYWAHVLAAAMQRRGLR